MEGPPDRPVEGAPERVALSTGSRARTAPRGRAGSRTRRPPARLRRAERSCRSRARRRARASEHALRAHPRAPRRRARAPADGRSAPGFLLAKDQGSPLARRGRSTHECWWRNDCHLPNKEPNDAANTLGLPGPPRAGGRRTGRRAGRRLPRGARHAGDVGADDHHGHERAQQPARARLLPGRRPRRRRGRGRRRRLHRRRQHACPAAAERPDLRRLVRLDLRDRGRGLRSAARTDGLAVLALEHPEPAVRRGNRPAGHRLPHEGTCVRDRRLGRHARGPHGTRREGEGLRPADPDRPERQATHRGGHRRLRADVQPRGRTGRLEPLRRPRRARRGVRHRRRRQRPLPGQGLERLARGDVPARAAHLHDSVPRTTRAGVGADHGRPRTGQGSLRRRADGIPVLRRRRSDLAGRPRRGAERCISAASR